MCADVDGPSRNTSMIRKRIGCATTHDVLLASSRAELTHAYKHGRTKERGRNEPAPRQSALAPAYIIPPMSGMPAPAPAGVFSGGSATIASVVRMFFAIEAAFCSAERTTMVGSVMPALT